MRLNISGSRLHLKNSRLHGGKIKISNAPSKNVENLVKSFGGLLNKKKPRFTLKI